MPSLSPYFRRVLGKPKYPGLWRGCVWAACASAFGPSGQTIYDLSGWNTHGALTGQSWTVEDGKPALTLPGSGGSRMLAPANAAHASEDNFSISLWIKLGAFTSGDIVGQRGDTNQDGWYLQTNSLRQVIAVFNRSGSNSSHTSSGTLSNTVMQHYAMVLRNGVCEQWFNGVLGGSLSVTTPTVSTTRTMVWGAYYSGVLDLPCSLDDMRLYNRALTVGEIKLLAARRGAAYETLAQRNYAPSAVAVPRHLFQGAA